MKKLNFALSIAAGLLGGLLSHYVSAPTVQAQAQLSAPREVRAQSFVLVNDKGAVEGVFVYQDTKEGPPTVHPGIKLFDGNGREIWSADNNFHILKAENSLNSK